MEHRNSELAAISEHQAIRRNSNTTVVLRVCNTLCVIHCVYSMHTHQTNFTKSKNHNFHTGFEEERYGHRIDGGLFYRFCLSIKRWLRNAAHCSSCEQCTLNMLLFCPGFCECLWAPQTAANLRPHIAVARDSLVEGNGLLDVRTIYIRVRHTHTPCSQFARFWMA